MSGGFTGFGIYTQGEQKDVTRSRERTLCPEELVDETANPRLPRSDKKGLNRRQQCSGGCYDSEKDVAGHERSLAVRGNDAKDAERVSVSLPKESFAQVISCCRVIVIGILLCVALFILLYFLYYYILYSNSMRV